MCNKSIYRTPPPFSRTYGGGIFMTDPEQGSQMEFLVGGGRVMVSL